MFRFAHSVQEVLYPYIRKYIRTRNRSIDGSRFFDRFSALLSERWARHGVNKSDDVLRRS